MEINRCNKDLLNSVGYNPAHRTNEDIMEMLRYNHIHISIFHVYDGNYSYKVEKFNNIIEETDMKMSYENALHKSINVGLKLLKQSKK